MTREELEQKVLECVSTTYQKPVGELGLATNFKTELGGPSIKMVGLASLIENEIDVLIPLPTAAACATIGELVDEVEKAL